MKLKDALHLALKIKSKELRKSSDDTYLSFLRIFNIYLLHINRTDMLLSEFGKREAMQYLDYILIHREVSALTRNNYLKAMKSIFYVLVDREYIEKNPFSGIRKLKAEKKKRVVYSPAECGIICNFLKEYDRGLLLAVSLCYYCAIRPNEIRDLKVGDIDLEKGLVMFNGTHSKNKDLALITMPQHLIDYCKELRLNSYPKNFYVTGFKLKPCATRCGKNAIRRTHLKVLRLLKKHNMLTDIENKSFYSWKDTAARDMINEGYNVAVLMKHFRHESLETTQKYLESFGVKNSSIRDMRTKIF